MENNNSRLQNIHVNQKEDENFNIQNQSESNVNEQISNTTNNGMNRFNLPSNNLTNNNLIGTNNNLTNNNLIGTNNNLISTNNNLINTNDLNKITQENVYSNQLQPMSTLPSVESVTAAISSVGANFNEDAVFAELTSQEDNRGYVRRPMNAFMVWSKQARRRIALAYPNLLNCEISKLLGREWGRMSSKEKEPYVALSTKLRENHNLLHPDYTYKPRKRRRKGFPIQNSMMSSSMGGMFNTGAQRYLNQSFHQSNNIQNPTFGNYQSVNMKTYQPTNSSYGLGNNLPPLNFQNGYLMQCASNKISTNPLNHNQFYTGNSQFYPQMNSTTSIPNYFQNFESNKIGSFLNIYGTEEELTTNHQNNDNTSGIVTSHNQNIDDMQNYCSNNIFNKNINTSEKYIFGSQNNNSSNQIDQNSKSMSHDSTSNFDLNNEISNQHASPKA